MASLSFLLVNLLIVLSISSSNIYCIASDLNQLGWDTVYGVEVVNEFPHDPKAFTEGLLYGGNDTLFESTGLYGQSSVRKTNLVTGEIHVIEKMNNSYFGEGLTLLNERLFQVTWINKTGFIYNRDNLTQVGMFTNPMREGWGLATGENIIYGSDGTSTLYAIDPQTFQVVKKHIVTYKGLEVHNLNELEYVNGEVWANVWQKDCIVRISSENGTVLGWIYLPNLRERLMATESKRIDVLNGIAWDQETNRIFVTGKLWPKLFEIILKPITRFTQDILSHCLQKPIRFKQ